MQTECIEHVEQRVAGFVAEHGASTISAYVRWARGALFKAAGAQVLPEDMLFS